LPGGHGAAQLIDPPAMLRGRGTFVGEQIVTDPDAAAFFDVDNTVVQGASLFHVAKGLYRRGFFPFRKIVRGAWLNIYFRMAGRENPDHIKVAQESSLEMIKDHTTDELAQAADEIYTESLEARIWPGTRAIAQRHLDVGQPVWLVTAAPIEVATVIADRLGLSGALGSVAEHVDGVYTGRLQGDLLHKQAKADAIAALAAERGYDLSRCHAYSDSVNDLPMLSLVGHPVAINPDSRLRHYAKEHGWEVRDYRTGRYALQLALAATAATAAAIGAGVGVLTTWRWLGSRRH